MAVTLAAEKNNLCPVVIFFIQYHKGNLKVESSHIRNSDIPLIQDHKSNGELNAINSWYTHVNKKQYGITC